MIKLKSVFIGIFLLVITQVKAQSIKNEIHVIQGVYGMEKKKLLLQAMQLNEKDSVRFWLIYDEYERKREDLGEERLLIVNDYVTSFLRLDEDKANQIAIRCFRNDQATDELHRHYYKIVRKEVSSLKAAQF